jgi:3-oxoacyl-[acyl-carrier-protein] synthase-3
MADGTTTPEGPLVEKTMRGLALAWSDFGSRLERVPVIEKLNRGALRIEDYRSLLCNLRQQVVDGACWIARAASNIGPDHFELRSRFMRHAVTEHRDFRMLEENYVSVGGRLEDIRGAGKNIGSEAFSAFMFHRASQPEPLDLLGAMFMIEGLGTRRAREWGEAIRDQLGLKDEQVSFLLYHADNDDDHLSDFRQWLGATVHDEALSARIVKTARVVGRLYALQLEELDHV